MNIFIKQMKNVFAKKVFLPLFFVALFVFSFTFVLLSFNINFVKASEVNISETETSETSSPKITQANLTTKIADDLPVEYSLFSLDKIIANFLTENKGNTANIPMNVGTQMGTSICWAFASLTALETTLYKSGLVKTNEKINFSELNLAYTTQVVNRNLQNIAGGNFDLAYEYLSSDNGAVYEQNNEGYNYTNQSRWATDSSATLYYADNFYATATQSNYRVLEAVSFPDKTTLSTDEEKLNLRLAIKNHILNYGGVTASIYLDSQNLVNNQFYICTNKNLRQNHMVTLVGWDDNFTQRISGTTYTGAYIVQNSAGEGWGMNGYFYIMYEDAFVENDVNGFSRVSTELENYINYNNMKETSYNDRFLTFKTNSSGSGETSYNIKNITEPFYITNIYKTGNVSNQYLSRIKIPTSYNNKETNFRVYVLNGLKDENIESLNDINNYYKTNFSTISSGYNKNTTPVKNKYAIGEDEYLFTSNQVTYYTVELDENIYVTDNYFAIIVEYLSGSVPQLANDDNTLSSPYLFTYKSDNALDWSSYYTVNNEFSFLPMIVQMQYDLGDIEYSYNNVHKTYDGGNAEIDIQVITNCNYQILYSLTGMEDDFTQRKPQIKDSGSYIVYFKITADFYNTVEDSIDVEIDKKDIIVTPKLNQSKLYGEGDQILGRDISGGIEEVAIRGRLSREEGEDVGKYQILQGTLELYSNQNFNKDNYNLVFNSTPIYFEITPRDLIVIPNLTTKTYGDSDPVEFTYLFSNLATGEIPAFNGVLSRENGESVGFYSITQNTLTLQDNPAQNRNQKDFLASNYILVLQNAQDKFEITKRNLIVTPNANQSKIYEEQEPVITYSYSNNVVGETPFFKGSLAREEGEDAGIYNYLIGTLNLVSSGTLLASNYNLVLNAENVYFLITYGALNGCSVEDIETTYNGSYYSVTPVNTLYNDISLSYSLNGLSWQQDNILVKDAGIHNIYVKFSRENYADNIIIATIKINTVDIVITPDENQSKVYGEVNEKITFSYYGNLEGEIPLFSGELSREIDTTATLYEKVGEYLINKGNLSLLDNGNFLAINYNLVFELNNLTFKIKPRELLISPLANQFKYYNMEDSEIQYIYSNVVVGETPLFSGELTRVSGKDVGKYAILSGSLTAHQNQNFLPNNYIITVLDEAYFEIKPAQITIKINNKQGYYAQEIDDNYTYLVINDSENTGSYNEGDNLNLTFICSVNSSSLKGKYPITCTSNNHNYQITVENGVYEILYNYYTIKFSAYNEIISSIIVEHFYNLQDNDFPKLPYKSGYKFNCWLVLTSNGTFSVVSSGYSVTGDATIVAMIETIDYSITYNSNGGDFTPVITTYNVETPDFIINVPTKQGYTFEGWYTNPNLLGECVTKIEQGSTGNKTLYAKYTINIYQIAFNEDDNLPYSFNYDGSTSVKYYSSFSFKVLLKKEYNQSYSKMKVYAKLLQDQNLIAENEIEENEQSEENIILLSLDSKGYYTIENVLGNYEIYCENITINSYSIFFLIDDNLVGQKIKKHGETLNAFEYPIIPEKEHYNDTVPYWEISGIESVEKDEIIRACYVPNIHVVTFVLPNGKLVKTNVNYGENVSTSMLEEAYKLGVFNYFTFDSSLNNITKDITIQVSVGSNAFILYIVLIVVAVIVTVITTVTIVKKRRRDTFNWWVYTKRK